MNKTAFIKLFPFVALAAMYNDKTYEPSLSINGKRSLSREEMLANIKRKREQRKRTKPKRSKPIKTNKSLIEEVLTVINLKNLQRPLTYAERTIIKIYENNLAKGKYKEIANFNITESYDFDQLLIKYQLNEGNTKQLIKKIITDRLPKLNLYRAKHGLPELNIPELK